MLTYYEDKVQLYCFMMKRA